MTANPATASNPTKSNPIVAMTSTRASAATLPVVPLDATSIPAPLGNLNESKLCGLALTRIDTLSAGLTWPGATSANWSCRSKGFSTRPTTCNLRLPSCQTPPTCRSKSVATFLVTATWSGPLG